MRWIPILTLTVLSSCQSQSGSSYLPLSTYDQFFNGVNGIIMSTAGATRAACGPGVGARDYRYVVCFALPKGTDYSKVLDRIAQAGYKPESGRISAPDSVTIYDKQGKYHYALQVGEGIDSPTDPVSGFLYSGAGYVGATEDTLGYVQQTLPDAATTVAAWVTGRQAFKLAKPCATTPPNTACMVVPQTTDAIQRIGEAFYAGDQKKFISKYKNGNFIYKGEEEPKIVNLREKMTVEFLKSADSQFFNVKNALAYHNILFKITPSGKTVEVQSYYRPGYTPPPYPPQQVK